MKIDRIVKAVLVFALLLLPSMVFAQDDMSETIDFATALETIRAEYGEDVLITDADFEADTEDDDFNCWEFELLLEDENDSTLLTLTEVYVCADADTGELITRIDDNDDMSDDSDDEDSDDDDNEETISTAPSISLDDALSTALEIYPDGVVTSIELEFENGVLVWDIEFDCDTRSVDVSAETGNVLEFGFENDDDDDNNMSDDSDDDDNERDDDDDDSDDRDDHDDDDDSDDDDDDDSDDDDDDD